MLRIIEGFVSIAAYMAVAYLVVRIAISLTTGY